MIFYSYGLPKSPPFYTKQPVNLITQNVNSGFECSSSSIPRCLTNFAAYPLQKLKRSKKNYKSKKYYGTKITHKRIIPTYPSCYQISRKNPNSNVEVKKVRYENFSGIDIADPIRIQLHLNSLYEKSS